jgi:hypothetical protein
MGVAMLAGMGLAAWTESALGGAKRARAIAAITALAIVLVVQGAVMGVILRRHHELERREAPEEWARLRAHARAAGMDAGP